MTLFEMINQNQVQSELQIQNKKEKHVANKKEYTRKWRTEENRKFYKALKIFGTDFSLIAKFFQTRSRAQIKNKFRKEEKVNNAKVEEALQKHKKMHLSKIVVNSKKDTELSDLIRQRKQSLEQMNIVDSCFSPAIVSRKKRLSSFNSVDSLDITMIEEIQKMVAKEEDVHQ